MASRHKQVIVFVAMTFAAPACQSRGVLFHEGDPAASAETCDKESPPERDAGTTEGGMLASTAAAILPDIVGHPYYGNTVLVAGDMDGDVFADIATTECHQCGDSDLGLPGTVRITYGRPEWSSAGQFVADAELTLPSVSGPRMLRLAPAGDLDGDGLADLLVALAPQFVPYEPGTAPPLGEEHVVYLLYGSTTRATGSTPLADSAAVIRSSQPNSYLGSAASGVGDLDGDGYADFAASSFDGTSGHIHLFFGGPSRLSGSVSLDSADVTFSSTLSDTTFSRIRAAGDVDGEGHDDFVVMAGTTSPGDPAPVRRAYLVRGGSSRPSGDVSIDATATVFEGDLGIFGVAAGDLDGDGRSDLAFGGLVEPFAIHIFLGRDFGPTVQTDDDDATVLDPNGNSMRTNLEIGDVTGDTLAELVVGDPDTNPGGGVFVWSAAINGDSCLPSDSAAYFGSYFVKYGPDGPGGASIAYREDAGNPLSVGDVNGDGKDDLLIGGGYESFPSEILPGLSTGLVYLILGMAGS